MLTHIWFGLSTDYLPLALDLVVFLVAHCGRIGKLTHANLEMIISWQPAMMAIAFLLAVATIGGVLVLFCFAKFS